MTTLLRLGAARGLSGRTLLSLAASVSIVTLTAMVAVGIRTSAGAVAAGATIDSAVLVGLIAPAAVLSQLLQDRAAWLLETATRKARRVRLLWFVSLCTLAALSCLACVLLTAANVDTFLLAADFTLFFAISCAGALVLGGPLGWTPAAALALAASTPGLIPFEWNYVAQASYAIHIWCVSGALLVVTGAAFVALDEHGIDRQRRMLERQPGVTDD